MAGGAPVAMLLGNGPGIPLAYVMVSVILLIFSVGYTAMARHHTSTGAFYSFVSRGLRQPAGGAAAFIALLGYNAMQIGLYGLFASAAAGFFSDILHITLPWWVYAFIAMAIIAVLGYRQVDLSVKVLSILVSLEFLIVLILDAAILIQGGQGGHPVSDEEALAKIVTRDTAGCSALGDVFPYAAAV
jgi:amino acid transporter